MPVRRPGSVARRQRRGFGVAASPLNPVKLDLSMAAVVGLLLVVLVSLGELRWGLQLLILLLYAIPAAGWLVWRTRRVINRAQAQRTGDDGA